MSAHPAFFAHRGASAYAPENTLAAFALAAQQGAPAIELDAKLTADRQVIVFHDLTLKRTTNGFGWLRGRSLAELRELDAGSWFSSAHHKEKIPLLSEVFETVGERLIINIELTNYASLNDGLVYEVVELIKKHGLQDRVFFSSFAPGNLALAARLLPDVPRGQLSYPGWLGLWQRWNARRAPGLASEQPYWRDITPRLVADVHARGRRVYTWTVNQPEEMRRFWQMGVDSIFTDDPPRALEILSTL